VYVPVSGRLFIHQNNTNNIIIIDKKTHIIHPIFSNKI
jgi:hypothetical protein